MTIHVRIVRRAGHFSSSGFFYRDRSSDSSRTLCGAEPTSYDITPRDLKRPIDPQEHGHWQVCAECKKLATETA